MEEKEGIFYFNKELYKIQIIVRPLILVFLTVYEKYPENFVFTAFHYKVNEISKDFSFSTAIPFKDKNFQKTAARKDDDKFIYSIKL
ncbi:hypothetical protein [Bacillus sp. EB600]|uniref:hypothetical protein n=1 Tax=Bacillus sp. EB600 TaxID=2806345 RepID=UPI00210BDA21|nr:hypothetical protein [Bacillus sp. EB600]MCQ6277699.1 hypothetical protein [Bacillus sp. EB600]